MKRRLEKIKKYIRNNKNATIYITIFIVYTLVMLGIVLFVTDGLTSCSSGSLSSIVKEKTEETSEGITTSADINVE